MYELFFLIKALLIAHLINSLSISGQSLCWDMSVDVRMKTGSLQFCNDYLETKVDLWTKIQTNRSK